MNPEQNLKRRIRVLTWVFIIGLFISGITAIPLQWELDLLANLFGAGSLSPEQADSYVVKWLLKVRQALNEVAEHQPFLYYGMDWLAFGHIVIGIAFFGALRDPVKNSWLFEFGMIACILVIPWAMIFGYARGIPFFWRLIDCSFGVFGIIPILFCRRWVRELSRIQLQREKV